MFERLAESYGGSRYDVVLLDDERGEICKLTRRVIGQPGNLRWDFVLVVDWSDSERLHLLYRQDASTDLFPVKISCLVLEYTSKVMRID
jgi:hypothetical protein